MSTATALALVSALTGLVTAVGALIAAIRGRKVVSGTVQPQVTANSQAINHLAGQTATPAVAAEVKQIVNGGAARD